MKHPLVRAVKRSLPGSSSTRDAYLGLLEARLRALEELAAGGKNLEPLGGIAGQRLAQRFLRPLKGRWDDGDENLVRGYLDSWAPRDEDPLRVLAGSLGRAAETLGRVRARPATLWFFLWEMESMLKGVLSLR